MQVKNRNLRHKRKIRIRKKINGLETKPRLAIYKSNKNIYVQAIDDLNHKTIATSSSLSKDLKSENLSLETAIIVVYYRNKGSIRVEDISSLKG